MNEGFCPLDVLEQGSASLNRPNNELIYTYEVITRLGSPV